MKTKLFYLFIAVFLISISGNAKPTASSAFNVISLIGPGSPGADWATDTDLSTTDGNVYTAVDMQFTAGQIKFRANHCWDTACTISGINTHGWGPALSTDTGWPSDTNASPAANGPNIQCPGGVWNVTFTLSTNSWSFTPGTPNAVIKISGTGVSASPVIMTTANGKQYSSKKVTLVPGNVVFDINGTLYGPAVPAGSFPTGIADTVGNLIPVTTTGIDYDVTFDYLTGAYTFAIATFPKIAIVGAGTTGGWPTGAVGEIDPVAMATTDGITYTLAGVPLTTGPIKFRQDNSWNNNWGGDLWPSGPTTGNNIPATVGNYDATFNRTTGAYSFSLNTIAIVGEAVGGWPTGAVGEIDAHQLSTVDGTNYTLANLVVTTAVSGGGAKFRLNNAWGVNWGGDLWPAGPATGNNLPTVAGTYNVAVNISTRAYSFTSSLAVKSFNASSFSAYPNPTQNSWNITAGNEKITSVQVFDILGKSVYAKTTSSNDVSVNASSLSKGTYFAKVATANGSSTVKLIKN